MDVVTYDRFNFATNHSQVTVWLKMVHPQSASLESTIKSQNCLIVLTCCWDRTKSVVSLVLIATYFVFPPSYVFERYCSVPPVISFG